MREFRIVSVAVASSVFLVTVSLLGLNDGVLLTTHADKTFKSPVSTVPKSLEIVSTHATPTDNTTIASKFKNLLGKVLGTEDLVGKKRASKQEVFGFLPFWLLDKRVYFRYNILSTIAYFGVDTDADGNFIKFRDNGKTDGGWDNWQSEELAEVIKKAKNNQVKFLLTIKGFDNETIEKLVACSRCRENLVSNSLREINEKGIDGVNLDFEYVGEPDTDTTFRFTQLVKDFSDKFHEQKPGSYVSVSTYAKSAVERKIHDIRNLAAVADSLFIMGYDFFRPASAYAGPTAPLGGAEKYGYDLKTTIDDYLALAPANKIILGLPNYGYDWPVENNKPNARTLEGSDRTGYPNMSSYVKSQYDSLNTPEARRWDEEAQVPFYSWFDEDHKVWRQCYYEDARSLGLKYDFIKEKGLRGVGIWALGYDDKYPELWDLLEEKFTK